MKLPAILACLVLCLPAWAESRLLSVGDVVPDGEFINQDGKPFHLREYQGRAVAFTFIFTRCPLPNYCPRITSQFLEAQHELAKGPPADWSLLSLSFDPEHDTPAQLSAYAKAHEADTLHWTFATAKPGAVTDFGASFGLTAVMEEGLLNHNLRTVVMDASGRVQCIFKGNEWTARELVWEMRKAMAERTGK